MRKAANKLKELIRVNTLKKEFNMCDFDKNLKDWAKEEFDKRMYRNENT